MSFGVVEILIVAGVSLIGAAIAASLVYFVVSIVCRRNESDAEPAEE
jgi:hypothetical protein